MDKERALEVLDQIPTIGDQVDALEMAIEALKNSLEVDNKDKLYCVSLNEFIRITTGWLYSLAPGYKPRHINEIVDEMIARFKQNAQHIGDDFFYHEVNWFELRVLVENVLRPIKQFRDLNLSKREYGLGIDVDDPNRQGIIFTSRYSSTIPEDEDFIDLDACIINIVSNLKRELA